VCGYGYEEHSPSSYTPDAENRDAAMSRLRITNIHTRVDCVSRLYFGSTQVCNAFKRNQEAETMVVSCKTLGTKISQTNREDYDSTGIKCLQAQSNAYNERVPKSLICNGRV